MRSDDLKTVDKVAPTWKVEDRVPQKHLRIETYIRFINYFIYINVYKTLKVKMLIFVSTHDTSTHNTYLKQYSKTNSIDYSVCCGVNITKTRNIFI